MAHLKACNEWRLEELDRSHPVIASATLGELEAAMAEASRLLRCPLQGKVERWMGGASEFAVGNALQWTPLREARHANLQWRIIRSGYTCLAHNAIEAFQVCYSSGWRTKLYHVQPLTAPESAAYFLKRPGSVPAMRLDAPLQSDFTPTRNPYGIMPSSMIDAALAHTRLGDIPEWEQPLHDFILLKLP